MMNYKSFKDIPDILTIPQMCTMLEIGRATAYRLVKEKQIASFKVGKKLHVPKKSVLNYLSKLAGESIT